MITSFYFLETKMLAHSLLHITMDDQILLPKVNIFLKFIRIFPVDHSSDEIQLMEKS